jgi:hypothetical protein
LATWSTTGSLSLCPDDDTDLIDGLPVTTALRTIGDLLDQHVDGGHVGAIAREAVLAHLVRLDEPAERIGPYALRYGIRRPGDGGALLEHLLTEIGTTTGDGAGGGELAERDEQSSDVLAKTAEDPAGRDLLLAIRQFMRTRPAAEAAADKEADSSHAIESAPSRFP